jgi:hypothetical protein
MRAVVTESTAPQPSTIAAHLPGAYFHDAWSTPAGDPSLTALGQFLKAASATPSWVNALMAARNRAVALLGLKNLGVLSQIDAAKPEASYRPGDRIGIFTLIDNTPNEVLLGDRDKHLSVVLSVHLARHAAQNVTTVTATTVVHVNNLLGKIYMLPVTPAHRRIVPVMLRAIAATAPPA